MPSWEKIRKKMGNQEVVHWLQWIPVWGMPRYKEWLFGITNEVIARPGLGQRALEGSKEWAIRGLIMWKMLSVLSCLGPGTKLLALSPLSCYLSACQIPIQPCLNLLTACQCAIFWTFSNFDFQNWQAQFPWSLLLSTQNPLPPLYFYPLMSITPRRTKNNIAIGEDHGITTLGIHLRIYSWVLWQVP